MNEPTNTPGLMKRNSQKFLIVATAVFLLALTAVLHAAIPSWIPHQGRIAVDNVNFDGTGEFRFLIYEDGDADHGNGNETAVWSHAETSPAAMGEPTGMVSIIVTKGLYVVGLGDPSMMAALPDPLEPHIGMTLFLRIWFNDGVNGFQQLAPDTPLGSVPFALLAARALVGEIEVTGSLSQLDSPDGLVEGALQVDGQGNVGIGTDTPAAGLQISSSAISLVTEFISDIVDGEGGFNDLGEASDVAFDGNLLAVAAGFDDSVTFIDVTDPANPVFRSVIKDEVGPYDGLDGAHGIAFNGFLLAVAAWRDNDVTLVDVANPASPVHRFTLRDSDVFNPTGFDFLRDARDVAFNGNLLAIAASGDLAVTLVDVSDPTAPVLRRA
ncbi:MAG: hypothetical protein O7E52_01150 [Candidatus Poribacteria bacterium]|nr:hypothetical protein [Candidatus Poribacteria bacterium]